MISRWNICLEALEASSPSRKDGMSVDEERVARQNAIAFCHDVGFCLSMNQHTIATASTYWQRFFLYESLPRNDMLLVASACLLLAGKVEENYKSLQSVVEMSYFVQKDKDDGALTAFKEDPVQLSAAMDNLVKAEEILLMTLDFEFNVSHPHRPLWNLFQDLELDAEDDPAKNQIRQIAWNYVNDSLHSPLPILSFSPLEIAVACLNLTWTTLGVDAPASEDGQPWWIPYMSCPLRLNEIEFLVMEVYQIDNEPNGAALPSNHADVSPPPDSIPSIPSSSYLPTYSPNHPPGYLPSDSPLLPANGPLGESSSQHQQQPQHGSVSGSMEMDMDECDSDSPPVNGKSDRSMASREEVDKLSESTENPCLRPSLPLGSDSGLDDPNNVR